MAYACNTAGFARLTSYAEARRHFDRVKPYRGESASAPRPIGTRSRKNKMMRELDDGSIAFRLFRTDCVTWHPDETLTVEGYPSTSTSAFIGRLAPSVVSHRQGAEWGPGSGPVLQLQSRSGGDYWLNTAGDYSSMARNPDYNRDTLIVNCTYPVKLHYSADRWLPVDPSELEPFSVEVIDRKLALKASREHHLPEFTAWLRMIQVCAGEVILPPPLAERASVADVAEQLRDGNFINAASLIPRGEKDQHRWARLPFNRTPVAPDAIRPGFMALLRREIYEEAGAIKIEKHPMVSPSAYARLCANR
jgi:hypothetical protein